MPESQRKLFSLRFCSLYGQINSGRALFLLKKYTAFLEKGWMISGRALSLLKKYTAFLEKGWGLGKGKTSFHAKRSFSLPQELTTLIMNSAFLKGLL